MTFIGAMTPPCPRRASSTLCMLKKKCLWSRRGQDVVKWENLVVKCDNLAENMYPEVPAVTAAAVQSFLL